MSIFIVFLGEYKSYHNLLLLIHTQQTKRPASKRQTAYNYVVTFIYP